MSSSLVEKVKAETQEFFNLPMDEKKKFWQKPGEVEGFGQAFVVSEEQKLDWGDLFFMSTLPTHFRKPRLFPKFPLPFRFSLPPSLSFSLLHTYIHVLSLSLSLFVLVGVKYQVKKNCMLLKNNVQACKINIYQMHQRSKCF